MAKYGKLTKLKSSVMKKLTSFGRSSSSSISAGTSGDHGSMNNNHEEKQLPVYVGKSRRRYLVDSETVNNPIFRELVERSSSSEAEAEAEEDAVLISCEVVLFEHLLWMLHNASNAEWQVSELVEFYAC
uniref:Small auxin up regulated protein n=1 Tax=Kalanchoe fedtschenkoi TaxID=63787 RepID=A0A7N0V9S2_KALFE